MITNLVKTWEQMAGNYNYDSVMDVQWPFGLDLVIQLMYTIT